MSVFHDQEEFLKAANSNERSLTNERVASKLINEEFEELMDEGLYFNNPSYNQNAIKEALDLIYVTAQYLNVTVGADKAKELWDLLHKNNMSKCVGGKLIKREDGKVLKPEGYKPMKIEEYL
jgi:predicted HAD superfamily Cof-like phosphohydrolase